jgi:hypothetical protein
MQPARILRVLVVSVATAALVGCGSSTGTASPIVVVGPPSPSAAPSPATASAVASPTSSSAPSAEATVPASANSRLDINVLPRADLTTEAPTAVCDPEPSQVSAEAGESTIACGDGLALAARAIRATGDAAIQRMWLRRPACTSFPCTEDQLNTASVVVQTAEGVFVVDLDGRLRSTSVPRSAPGPFWPDAGSSSVPATSRPAIANAPAEINGRTALPYCGKTDDGNPASVAACFRDAVLAGRAAELDGLGHATEGGDVLQVFRFGGTGSVVVYSHFDRWIKQTGALILNPDRTGWSLDPWDGGSPVT